MAISKMLKPKEKSNERVLSRYNNYLKYVNGTKHLGFEEEYREVKERLINNILEKNKLSKRNKKFLEDYYLHLCSVLPSLDSRKSYLGYAKILGEKLKKDFDKITERDLREFFVSLEKKRLKATSIFNSKMYVRAFLRWVHGIPYNARQEEYPDVIKWISLKKDKGIRNPDEVLTPLEVRKIASVADNPRDSAIHLTLFETGARSGEFLRIKIKDVKFDKVGAVIKVTTGKHEHYKKIRNLRLIASTPALKKWVEVHPLGDDKDAPLWITLGSWLGRPLGKDGLKRIIKTDGRLAKIPKQKLFAHSYRHGRVYDLLRKGFNDKDLRLWFGWSNISNMPSIYSGAYGEKDVEEKLLRIEGIEKKEVVENHTLRPKTCVRCGNVNSATLKYCEKCYMALDLKAVMETDENQRRKEELINLLLNMPKPQLEEFMKKRLEQNPEIVDRLKELKC